MATNRSIRGLSRAGFRVQTIAQTGTSKQKVSSSTVKLVDVDDHRIQWTLQGERDNFIRVTNAGTFTVTIASPGVFTKSAHGYLAGDILTFSTTGALPTGLTAGTKYYVIATGLSANAFRVSATYNGSVVNTSGSQSGTHTVTPASTRIVGLSRKGFRIKSYAAANTGVVVVNIKQGVVLVDLTDYNVCRVLKRNFGQYVVSSNATSVTIRGLQNKQNGFDIAEGGSGASVLTSTNVNVTDEDDVTIGTVTYSFETALTEVKATDTVTTSGTPASTRASGTITTSATGAADGNTITIGGTTYTFKTALTAAGATPNEILRTGVIDVDLTNLKSALEGTAGAGTNYGTGTVTRTDISLSAVTSHVLTITAASYKASVGNAILLSKVGANLAVSGANLASGVNETVTINGHVYTFVEALDAATADEVLINGQDVSLTNLAAAINGAAGAGSTYGTGTVVNADVTSGAMASHAITLTAKSTVAATGNALTLAKVGSHLAVGGATFSGGVDPVANEVLIGVSADASLTNLSEAINAGANIGVDYSTGTVANPDATSAVAAAHKLTISPVQGGSTSIAVSTTAVTLSFAPAVVTDKLVRIYRLVQAAVNPAVPNVYTQLRRHYKSWISV